jgi:hypothetical protein
MGHASDTTITVRGYTVFTGAFIIALRCAQNQTNMKRRGCSYMCPSLSF